MEQFEFETIEDRPIARILRLKGPLTLKTLFDFQTEGRRSHSRPLIIDLREVPYMDSAGLGALLGVYASCQRHGHAMVVSGVSDRILTLFQISHIDEVLPRAVDIEAAEEMLNSGKAAKA